MPNVEKWQKYWQPIQTPMHRDSEADFHGKLARELSGLLEDHPQPQSVLDLGCGNGVLYAPLGFDRTDYTGVDFSDGMLDDFRQQHPGVHLVAGDGSSYRDDKQYDLIFSSGVLQFFDRKGIHQHLETCRDMLTPDGVIVHASVPWSTLRWWYRAGWGPGREPYPTQPLKRLARPFYTWWKERLGYWYSPAQIARYARHAGYECQFYGSKNFIYRFHVVLKPIEQSAQGQPKRMAA